MHFGGILNCCYEIRRNQSISTCSPLHHRITVTSIVAVAVSVAVMSYSGFPDITIDEYGRTFCAAHERADCHICCMSFTDMNDEVDETPSDRNVGIFIPDADLIEWHAKMKKKMPSVFPPDDKVFGDQQGQHPYGTKLLTHFDDDPNKPMNCTVVGSWWMKDKFSSLPGMTSAWEDGKEPMYVILIGGELSQFGLMDAHMGEEGPWKVVGHDPSVNERYDALARAHQNVQGRDDNGEDESDSDSMVTDDDFRYSNGEHDDESAEYLPRQNQRVLRERKTMKPWNQSVDGDFIGQLFLKYFSSTERDHINKCFEEHVSDSEKIESFPLKGTRLEPDELNFYARLVIAQMAVCFANNYDSVILQNERRTKFQAIELDEALANQNGVPCIAITYATDPEGIENPKLFLRGDKFKIMEIPNRIAVAVEDHLLDCVSNDHLNDIGSGLLYHEGFLVPPQIISWNEGNASIVDINKAAIPDVNFGIELELSCASGNYQWRIAKHMGVEIENFGAKGGKGGFFPPQKNQNFGARGGKGGYFPPQKNPPKGSNRDGSQRHDKWKLVYDRSIQANPQNPQSQMFEFVSKVLSGQDGLDEMSNVIEKLSDVTSVRTNRTMGLHVHVEAKESDYSLKSMKSICQRFLIHEDAMDSFLPYHRRTGAEKSHSFFESNTLSMMQRYDTLKDSLGAIISCRNRKDLYSIMNLGMRERYHKMNLQNLATGRQPTIEFRQHHATKDGREIEAWVCFCILFVINSSQLPMLKSNEAEETGTFDSLFDGIIRCPYLKQFYSRKRLDYNS